MMKEKIKSLIKEVLKNLGIKEANFVVGHPDDLRNGDYFTNAAMVYVRNFETGQDKPSRMEVAETIGRNIKDKDRDVLFEEVDVASPGFINFYLKKEIFNENTKQILHNFFLFALKPKNLFTNSSWGCASGENLEKTSLIFGLMVNAMVPAIATYLKQKYF